MATMTEEWVSFWYQCLAQNIDYSHYCTAKTAGDAETCQSLEARFECIAEIHQDFGAMDGWPDDGMQSRQWQEWFEPRQHLFMASATVITDPSAYVPRCGHLLLEIPLRAHATNATPNVLAPTQHVDVVRAHGLLFQQFVAGLARKGLEVAQ